ncbi:Uncharacterised protein [Vibrio cholerae]|nr:Uncharacterised protein [Vibrio cholerae]
MALSCSSVSTSTFLVTNLLNLIYGSKFFSV